MIYLIDMFLFNRSNHISHANHLKITVQTTKTIEDMKPTIKNLSIGALLVIALFLPACSDYLEQSPKDESLDMETVFQKRRYSEEFLANIYSYIPDNPHRTTTIPWDGLSDDMEVVQQRQSHERIHQGNWNASSNWWNWWPGFYAGIRAATYFIQHIGENAELQASISGQNLIVQYTGEARFLRAYFYFCLLRQYGPFIIIGDEVIAPDLETTAAEMRKSRSSYDECVQYIVDELNKAQNELPYRNFSDGQPETERGRATKLMCPAIKSRMLLLAASPQFNERASYLYASFKNKDGKQLVNLTPDREKWKAAADAAYEIIDYATRTGNTGLHRAPENQPYLNCRDVFLEPYNQEIIFCKYAGGDFNSYERSCITRIDNGYGAMGVTQSLVDEFETATGKRINETGTDYKEDGFSIAPYPIYSARPGETLPTGVYNMWVNREPRFYVNVLFHGRINIHGTNKSALSFFYTGNSGKSGTWDYSPTGYSTYKNVHQDTDPATSKYISRPFVLIRYAEMLLNFAEAANEYGGPTFAIGGKDAYWAVNQIRDRAGLPPLPTGLNKDAMQERIRHERRVELCMEYLRYFDTRRWLIAEQTDGGLISGMNVDADGSNFFKRTAVEKRIFRKSFYLFPIPQSEINKNDNIVQNPGW
jgi:hypothetical protein